MKTNQAIITTLLALLVGLLIGYLLGATMPFHQNYPNDNHPYNQMTTHEHDSFDNHQMGGMMHGMMFNSGDQTVQEFEQAWLMQMIVHHQGAVRMSEELLERTDRPELAEFAQNIINTQSKEMGKMQTWLNNWFN